MRIEHWWYALPLRLRSLVARRRVEREMDEELQFHLEQKIAEGLGAGLAPAAARHRAMRAMGGLEQRREEIRDAWRIRWWTDFADDVRYALRGLRRTPGVAALVVATLAVGIGMTAMPFSMVDALLLRPYPVPRPGDVVSLVGTSRDHAFENFSYREYLDLRDKTKSYDGVIASTTIIPAGFATARGATPEVHGAMLVSGNFFSVLGIVPQLGRGFRADEDAVPGRDAVAVLAADFWRQAFAADPKVVGRHILVDGRELIVVGVAPDSFPGLMIFSRPDLYLPLGMARELSIDPRKDFFEDRDDRELAVRARLAAGTPLAAARAEIAALARDFARSYPATSRDRGAGVHTFFEMRTRADDLNWKFAIVFTFLALSVLLVACTNVAGLLLSRARTRAREIAVRLALGAGRGRLTRLLLTEALVLAGLGGLGGVAIGYAGIHGFLQSFTIPTELPVKIPFRMDARLLVAIVALAVGSAVVCGLAPALRGSRSDLATGLKAADVELPGPRRLWGRNLLVVAQVAISLMLLTSSLLMARSFRRAALATEGFAKDHLLMVRLDPRLLQYDRERTAHFYEQLTDRARAAPGVRFAGLTRNPPLGLDGFAAVAFVPEGYDMPGDRKSFTAASDTVSPGFLETMGIAILRGRDVRPQDAADAPRVALVNEAFARRYWPDQEALGKRFLLDGDPARPVEIVGIARTIKVATGTSKPQDFVYLPLAQHPQERMILMLRTAGEPLLWVDVVRGIVHDLDPNLPLLETRSYASLYRYSEVDGPGVAVHMTGTMGAVGLLLTLSGLYGLVAYNVSRRTREIGIRMAIGAGPAGVLRLFLGKGLALVGIGTAIGLALGYGVERLMNAMLFDVGGIDVVAYLIVVPAMLVVTMLAAYLPARRAARIAPTVALRYE
jgi:macrolide transport system ATP-binding/permease protein